ncbi:ABC transporter permease subunit [Marinitoga aeolica]|uniref:ABC transporter permease n=1 Tax=Marinitoga aeolica TaxID=2809031 RepID=A0ABY8PSN5_9BACT|nr:ABC transporter permease subunit [Marinitoga aeolica]WGS65654.1 ABC transporter permease [Marinitoga aeolica]
MNLIKKEFKFNFKNLFIWIIVITLFNLMFISLSDIISEENSAFMNLLKRMPKTFLDAFNMDPETLLRPEGMLGTEGMTFMFIFFGLYASMLASKLFAGEYDNKTIEYLLIKPYSRNKIFLHKFSVILINAIILFLVFLGTEFWFFNQFVNREFSNNILFALAIYLFVIAIFFAAIATLISTLIQTRKLTNSISLGLLFFMYFGYTVTEGVKNTELLRKLSVFYYIPIRETLKSENIYLLNSFIIILISLMIFYASQKLFEKQDISV